MNSDRQTFADMLLDEAARWAGCNGAEDLLRPVRKLRRTLARQGVMLVLREEHSWQLVEVGRLLRRNHSTVSHGCKRMQMMLRAGELEAIEVVELLRAIRPPRETDRAHYVETAAMARASLMLLASFRRAADDYERAARSFLQLAEGVARPAGGDE